jgi:predicted nucleic acid-binding protein
MKKDWKSLFAAEKVSVDTNILVYAVADEGGPKRKVANDLLEWMSSANALIALQTLSEFYAVSTRKYNLAPSLARELVAAWQTLFPTIATSPSAVLAGIDASINHRLSFWDALLLVTLKATQVTVFFSEDLQHRQVIDGVKIINPFAELQEGNLT